MPPRANEVLVEPLEMFDDGKAIHDHETADELRMIERETQRDQCAAIMPDDVELTVPKCLHQRDDVVGHRALRRLGMFGLVRRQTGTTVAA